MYIIRKKVFNNFYYFNENFGGRWEGLKNNATLYSKEHAIGMVVILKADSYYEYDFIKA